MNDKNPGFTRKILRAVDTLFDNIYSSSANPLYRTGTITVALLLIMMLSGIYLFLFYSITAPYEAVAAIQSQIFLGRFMRALHRYATDTALVVALVHLMRMFIEGKTFGPRTLAWISGFVLLAFLFLSAFTGYILVWDRHALLLANAGAKLLDLIHVFNELPSRTFSGEVKLDSSFFFINLFIHIALPLVMALGILVHTLKLKNAQWLPSKKIFWSVFGVLSVLAAIYPLKLMPKANMLQIPTRISIDWFYGFWIPASKTFSASTLWSIGFVFIGLGVLAPWWWRPKYLVLKKKSSSNKDFCKACERCTKDCPYHAISMTKVSGASEGAFKQMAKVDPNLCVSCGICAASCSLMHLGPPNLKAVEQIENTKKFISSQNVDKDSVIFIYCASSYSNFNNIKKTLGIDPQFDFHFYKQECIGSLHMKTLRTLASACAGVFVIGCSPKACQNREGPELFEARLTGKQEPHASKQLQNKVYFLNSGFSNTKLIRQQKNAFLSYLKNNAPHPNTIKLPPKWSNVASGLLFSGLLCFIIAYVPNIAYSFENHNSLLRLSWRLAGQEIETCKRISDSELKKIPKHMRNPKGMCKSTLVNYKLLLSIDNKQIIKRTYYRGGLKGDGAIFVSIDIPINPGQKNLALSFMPVLKNSSASTGQIANLVKLQLNKILKFESGKIKLVSLDTVKKKLFVKHSHPKEIVDN